MDGFRKDAEKLRGDWDRVGEDLARSLDRFAREIAKDVGLADDGVIYLKVTAQQGIDKARQARSQSNITPKKQRVILSKLLSICSILSSKLKRRRENRSTKDT